MANMAKHHRRRLESMVAEYMRGKHEYPVVSDLEQVEATYYGYFLLIEKSCKVTLYQKTFIHGKRYMNYRYYLPDQLKPKQSNI